SRLPRELRGLMGEANLCYARGDHDDAIKMCMEIIRLVPYAAEPFETLSMIYDERGEPERSLQYSLLAAHLSPRDADQWLHLADMCLKQGESMKAINCYAKAFKVRPEDYNIIWESAKLHQKLGLIQKAMGLYKQVVALMPKSLAADSVALARDMAKNCHSNKESSLAVDLLEQALLHHGPAFKDEDANMLCELLILLQRFQDVLEVHHHYHHVIRHITLCDITDNRDIVGIAPPSDLPIDLQSKVVVAMVHLRKSHLVHDIFTKICEHDPKDIGDLHFDIAEAYTEVGEHVQALVVLNLLVTSPNYSLAAVWLKHAECERICGNLEKSLKSYRQCVRLAPGHIEAHIKYAETLKLAGRYSEANKTLEDADSYEAEPDTRMQLHLTRYHTLKEWSEKSKSHRYDVLVYVVSMWYDVPVNQYEPLEPVQTSFNHGHHVGEVKVIMKSASYFCKESDKASAVFLDGNPAVFTNSEWLKLFKEVIVMLVRCHRYQDAIRLSDGAQWYSPWYDNSDIRNLLERVVLSVCLISGNYKMAYNVIRWWLISSSDSNHLWNIFNQITARTGEVRHHRFCLRRLIRVPNNMALVVLNGHNWLASGTYKHALGEYERAHKMDPENPLYLLLIGVVFFHISCQKYTDHKHSLVVQGLAFFEKYRTARRLDQESYYNLGRALHQIGLETFALHYYLRALDSQPVVVSCPGSESKSSNPHFDLTCEIGFNLSLIYRKSGNIDLANQTIHKYCVV
uniref:General transcription factor IIIC, polypeptide 3 n=1 Tax=Ciona savignyi TaxID=51511 RepID=H2ZEG1_CIOSA